MLGLVERASDQLEALVGLAPRLMTLLGDAESTVARARVLVDRIAVVTEDAAVVAGRADRVVERIDPLVSRLALLLDQVEPSLVTLQPTLDRLAETTHPDEVDALVRMIDQLPVLTERLQTDIMPMMESFGSVAPDLHDLLDASRELNEMLGKLPGFGRIKKRVEEEQAEDEAAPPDA